MASVVDKSELWRRVPGLLRFLTIIVYVIGVLIFLCSSKCSETQFWFGLLFPLFVGVSSVALSGLIIFIAIDAFDYDSPKWILSEFLIHVVVIILSFSISLVSLLRCDESLDFMQLLGPWFGICGSFLLAVGTVIWYVQKTKEMRKNEEEEGARVARKSIFV
ncbi:hypothetical protein ACFFRR_004192 [Megaselia abdita]